MQFEELAGGFTFLEAPRVDEDDNLYFSDVVLGNLYRRSPAGEVETLLTDRKWLGGIALTDGGVVCSGQGNLLHLDLKTRKTRLLVEEIDGRPILSINDIQPDAHGSIYCGVIDIKSLAAGQPPTDGYLFRIDPDGRATKLASGISISNGMGFSPDGGLLYHADTFVGVWVYELGTDRGIRSRRMFAPIKDCDGLTVDAEGGVWVAACQSGEIVRYSPDGAVERRHRFPMAEIMSLTFGGKDLRDLYVVTASPNATNMKPNAGGEGKILRARSDIPGQRTPLARF